jgi:hypothetical protein
LVPIKKFKIIAALYANFETNQTEKWLRAQQKPKQSPIINVPENSILPPSKGLGFIKKGQNH